MEPLRVDLKAHNHTQQPVGVTTIIINHPTAPNYTQLVGGCFQRKRAIVAFEVCIAKHNRCEAWERVVLHLACVDAASPQPLHDRMHVNHCSLPRLCA